MNPEEYEKMRRLEDHYWWFVARRTLCIELWRRHAPRGLVLDVGCGTGAVAQELSRETDVVGLDFTHLALRHAQGRGLTRLIQADGAKLPVRDASVAGVVALDIFEHIEDDTAAFAEAARVLQPGGVLVLSVPAYKWLWGPHDVDVFASARNALLPMFWSRSPAPGSAGTDAFCQDWSALNLWMNPPFGLMGRILQKATEEKAVATLVVPAWKSRPWWPIL